MTIELQAQVARGRRQEALVRLERETWDMLVIGGGITGAGVALDAAARGLRVALVERDDFAGGTSSTSTKLLHGGVRYLAQFDIALVREGLHERHVLTQIAPHLAHPLPFLLPVYRGVRPLGLPFRPPIGSSLLMDAGLTAYDLLAGRRALTYHRRLSSDAARRAVPPLRAEGLESAFIYYDGQTDDTRLVLAVLAAARAHGAVALNYVEVTAFPREGGRITGATLREHESGGELTLRAERVVNATGVWSGGVQALAAQGAGPATRRARLAPSKGVHIVVPPSRLDLRGHAVVIPETEDGRISFAVPWGAAIVLGTTDTPYSGDPRDVRVNAAEVDLLLRDANRFMTANLTRDDVISVFAGLRPLVDTGARATSKQSRMHAVSVGAGGMVSITGGKLTTYRRMAADGVDRALHERPGPWPASTTEHVPLGGADGLAAARVTAPERVRALGLPEPVGTHLLASYGAEAESILALAEEESRLGEPLAPGLPYIAAEAVHAAREEYAMTAGDVLRRRTHLALEDRTQGRDAAPRVVELLAEELGWTPAQQARALDDYELEAARYTVPRE